MEAPVIKKPAHWSANQWAGFYMIGTSVTKELNSMQWILTTNIDNKYRIVAKFRF